MYYCNILAVHSPVYTTGVIGTIYNNTPCAPVERKYTTRLRSNGNVRNTRETCYAINRTQTTNCNHPIPVLNGISSRSSLFTVKDTNTYSCMVEMDTHIADP